MSFRKYDYADLEKWRKTINKYNKRYYAKTALYEKRPWTPEEVKEIMERKMCDRELSKKLKRSMKAIVSKRCKENEKIKNHKGILQG